MAQVNIQTTISPYTQEPVCTRPLLTQGQLDVVIADAVKAQKAWRKVTLDERIVIAEKWMVSLISDSSGCVSSRIKKWRRHDKDRASGYADL